MCEASGFLSVTGCDVTHSNIDSKTLRSQPPWADRAKLHDDFDLFGNARITSHLSEIPTVACRHSKPITWRVLAPNVTSGTRSKNHLRTISICDDGARCEMLEIQHS